MLKNSIVKKASLFTLILAFMVATVAAIAGVMNDKDPVKEKSKKTEEAAKSKKAAVLETWYYIGGENDDPLDPDNYTDDPSEAPPCDAFVEQICQIRAPRNGNSPHMEAPIDGSPGQTVSSQISDVQLELDSPNGNPQPNETVTDFRSK